MAKRSMFVGTAARTNRWGLLTRGLDYSDESAGRWFSGAPPISSAVVMPGGGAKPVSASPRIPMIPRTRKDDLSGVTLRLIVRMVVYAHLSIK